MKTKEDFIQMQREKDKQRLAKYQKQEPEEEQQPKKKRKHGPMQLRVFGKMGMPLKVSKP